MEMELGFQATYQFPEMGVGVRDYPEREWEWGGGGGGGGLGHL